MDPAASHYRRLGVTPAATTEEIRVAYRRLAATFHPDRTSDGSAGDRALAERRMREINEAWRVLQDPARRRAYDDERRRAHAGAGHATAAGSAGSARTPVRADDDDLVDAFPPMTEAGARAFRHGPWIVVAFVLLAIFVGSAYANRDRTDNGPNVPKVAEVGSCLDVHAGPSTSIIDCAQPHQFKVLARVVAPSSCPAGTEGRRLATDGLFDCLDPA